MTAQLPPNLLALFAPRPPLRFLPPSDHPSEDRKTAQVSGIAAFLPAFREYIATDDYKPTESHLQRTDRLKLEKKERQQKLLKDGPALYKPHDDPNIRGDAFKTLIVARLSYDATEQDLESEFGRFGPIERIRIVADTHQDEKPNKKKKKHRGYAFVVYEREKDMRAALENCEGIRIKDRRIKVDVERGRTVKFWKPRRFGGGLGGRGYTKAVAPRALGPGFGPGPAGGGFRGGFRGGFDGGRGRGSFPPRTGGRGAFQDRGGFGGGRGGIGYQGGDRGYGGSNGHAAPTGPRGAGPSAPAGGYESRGGGRSFDDRSGGYRGDSRGSRSFDDRSGFNRGGGSGSNMEPVRPRDGGYRDRPGDRDGGYGGRPRTEEDSRKRQYESNGYDEDPRKIRRY